MKRSIAERAPDRATVRATLLVMLSCFGLGWGLHTPIREAHACSTPLPRIGLQLDTVDGDGDAAVEEEFWKASGSINDDGELYLLLDDGGAYLDLMEVEG